MKKGVRQGDPLSLFLFIVTIEGLITALKEALEKGYFKGIKLLRNESNVVSLHYANKAMLLGEWNSQNI